MKRVLPLAVTDLGAQQVKNIEEPVRVYGLRASLAESRAAKTLNALPGSYKPSIVVLPFANTSSDPEQDYFADGITEDLITALSRFRWLFVIARNSSFALKGRVIDIVEVRHQLGIRYVLEGSVRRAGNLVRVTAQLVAADSNSEMWAGRFDRDLTDIFALQDEITESVVSAIEPNLRAAEIERARAKATDNLEAYDLYLRALPELDAYTEAGFRRAEVLLLHAVERDPDYADAWGALADCRGRLMVGGWIDDWDADAARNRQAALQAVRCDPENGLVLSIAAWCLASLSGILEQGVTFCERALYLQPNSPTILTNCGWVLIYNDESDRALTCLEKARRLNPLDPRGYITLNGIAAAHFFESKFGEAEQFTRRALEMSPGHPISLRYLTAALAQMGRLDEAKQVAQLLQSTHWDARRAHLNHTGYRSPKKRDFLFAGLRMAGVSV